MSSFKLSGPEQPEAPIEPFDDVPEADAGLSGGVSETDDRQAVPANEADQGFGVLGEGGEHADFTSYEPIHAEDPEREAGTEQQPPTERGQTLNEDTTGEPRMESGSLPPDGGDKNPGNRAGDPYENPDDNHTPTREEWLAVRERVAPLLHTLGDHSTPHLGEPFRRVDDPTAIAEQHLEHLGSYLPKVHDDAHAASLLAPQIAKFAERPILESQQVTGYMAKGLLSPQGAHIGRVSLRFVQGEFVAETTAQTYPSPDGDFHTYNENSSGDLIVASMGRLERYRAKVVDDGTPRLYREVEHAISQEDVARFSQFSTDLASYEELYWQAIAESGFDASKLREQLQGTGQERPDFSIIPRMSETVATYYRNHGSTDTVDRMNMLGGILADNFSPLRTARLEETPEEDIMLLQDRIGAYFRALITNGFARGYETEW